jgi:hypothetical protein
VVQQFTDTDSPRAFGHTTANWLALLPGPEAAGSGFAAEASTEARAVTAFCKDGGQCLVAGTLVWMADGTTEPVERVKSGDWVLSRDPATGKVSASRVGQCTQRQAGSVVAVTLSDSQSGQSQTVVVSPEHPFYVDGRGFVAAASLGIGSQIVTRAGPCLTVTAVEERHDSKNGYAVYNFVVPGDHTYFVGTLEGGAWVHNPLTCTKTLADWLKDDPELLQEARDQYKSHPQWQGIDPDKTPVFLRTEAEVEAIRGTRGGGERGGHHPHGLKLGGPTGQTLTLTGDRQVTGGTNALHAYHNGLQRRIINAIKKQ